MTDKELRKLSRLDLLEIMHSLSVRNDELEQEITNLQQENASLKEQLDSRKIRIEKAGSLAKAALELAGVFEAAQDAANLYLENLEQYKQSGDSGLEGSG